MKKMLEDARKSFDALKEQDIIDAAKEREEKKTRAEEEYKKNMLEAKGEAADVYLEMPKKIEEALTKRRDFFTLYEYTKDYRDHSTQHQEVTSYRRMVMDELKELLKRDGVKYKEQTHYVCNEPSGGSDPYTYEKEEYRDYWLEVKF